MLPDDTKDLAPIVLSHRIVMTPEAELEGVHAETVVAEAVQGVAYRSPRTGP